MHHCPSCTGIADWQRTEIQRLHRTSAFNGPGAAPRRQFQVGQPAVDLLCRRPRSVDVRRIRFQGNLSTVQDRMAAPTGAG